MMSNNLTGAWGKYMCALDAASIAILVRNIVRIVEYSQGSDGFIASHEMMLYIFDAFLIFCVVLTFHPGRIIKAGSRSAKVVPSDSMALIVQEDDIVSHGRVSKKSLSEEI